MKNPSWWTKEHDSGWERVKTAFARDWEQTKHDVGSKRAADLGQNAADTVKQATGQEIPPEFVTYEPAFRFGYGARTQYKSRPWDKDLEKKIAADYSGDWFADQEAIRRAYEYKGH